MRRRQRGDGRAGQASQCSANMTFQVCPVKLPSAAGRTIRAGAPPGERGTRASRPVLGLERAAQRSARAIESPLGARRFFDVDVGPGWLDLV
jgi:hypothetical protein